MALEKDDGCQDCKETRQLEEILARAEGLVFDCDGTILDTMPLYYETWKRSCNELELEFPEERFLKLAGVPVKDIFQMLIDEQHNDRTGADKLSAEYCMEVKRKYMKELEQEEKFAGPIDVVCDIIKKYHRSIPMAVASSGWRDHVLEGLERNQLLSMFGGPKNVVTTCDEAVKNPKPAPDIFLVAAQRLGGQPEKCVGFEDGDHGMAAIRSANFLYACDVRLMHMYPRNVEKRRKEQEK
mmetsp:Transcript_35889/g.50851  ORF Transcript_35889/g.50851 Transcript_35889/m.50851 type:complete len:240 (+) Transcript_35889:65-784(+)